VDGPTWGTDYSTICAAAPCATWCALESRKSWQWHVFDRYNIVIDKDLVHAGAMLAQYLAGQATGKAAQDGDKRPKRLQIRLQ